MSGNKSFFSFGPNGSHIYKSSEGLKYRHIAPTLNKLILSGDVVDVDWAVLGSTEESWVVSYKDKRGKNKLSWGDEIPWELEEIFKSLRPNPHLYVFLGPKDSFMAWGPSFIRWIGLPPGLEACLQSWLTPAGWKSGPPRMVVWGRKGAYFALSEYGEVAYRLGSGDTWSSFKEIVEEWEAEAQFPWDDLAYIALDPTTPDQFVAVREDGIWAGSIEDGNEAALETFALSFFTKAEPKGRTPHQLNGTAKPTESVPDEAARALYEKWAAEVATSFASALVAVGGERKTPKKLEIRNRNPRASIPTTVTTDTKAILLAQFPYLPSAATLCKKDACLLVKEDPSGLRACKHDVERLFRASGSYSYDWLRQERIRWHPDRFGRLCTEEWRETGRKLAEEMFKIIDSLIADLAGARATMGGV